MIRADARLVDPPVAPPVDLMVRAPAPVQIDHGETVRLRIVHDETETDPIRPVPLATAIRVRVAAVTVVPRAPAETGPIRHDRPVMAIRAPHVATATDHTRRDQRVMAIHVPHVAVATVHIRRGPPVMETDHTLRALGVTATALVALRALAATALTLLALLAMVIPVHAVTVIVRGLTGRAAIARMATAHAGIGNPRAVSVVRSVRR